MISPFEAKICEVKVPQLSVIAATGKLKEAVQLSLFVLTVKLSGQVIAGGVISCTLIICSAKIVFVGVDELLHQSIIVQERTILKLLPQVSIVLSV